jgi:hypothetical protein
MEVASECSLLPSFPTSSSLYIYNIYIIIKERKNKEIYKEKRKKEKEFFVPKNTWFCFRIKTHNAA